MPVLQTLNHTVYVKLFYVSFQCKGAQIYHTSSSNLKILCNRKVTWSKFYAEDKHVLGATLQNLVTWTTWLLEHVYPHFSDNVTKVPTNPHNYLPVWNRPKNPFHHGQVLSVIMGLE